MTLTTTFLLGYVSGSVAATLFFFARWFASLGSSEKPS